MLRQILSSEPGGSVEIGLYEAGLVCMFKADLPLDGGKILMGVLRKIYQPLRRVEIPLTVGGWVVLLGLTVYATAHDLVRVAHGMLG